MSTQRNPEEFYKNLQEKLSNDTLWPSNYLFKFIVPTDADKIAKIEGIFDGTDAEISTRESSKGNFTSVSVRVKMKSAEAVIVKYKEVSVVEGIISL